MKTYKEKIGVGIVATLIGFLMYWLSITQINATKTSIGASPRTVPIMLAKLTILLSLILIIQGLVVFIKEKKQGNYSIEDIKFHAFPFIIYLIMWGYALLLGGLGYFVSSLICLPLVVFLLKERKKKSYIILAIVILVVFVAFGLGLNIPLSRLGLLF